MAISLPRSQASGQLRGILYLLASVLILPTMDGIAKHLSSRYPVLEISWARFFWAFVILLPFAGRLGWRNLLLPPQPGLQLARSVTQVIAVSLFFTTLSFLPLADTLALCFLYPLMTVGLARLLLGEQVPASRWLAVAAGFLGALVIIRPGIGVFQPASLLGLVTSLVFAAFLILTRKLAGSSPPAVTLIWGTLVGAVVTSLIVPLVWVTPAMPDLLLMIAMGLIGAIGHLLLLKAYELAPVSVLSPLGYAEIIGAASIGYLFFGELPDLWTWVGVAIIIAAGISISLPPRRQPGAAG